MGAKPLACEAFALVTSQKTEEIKSNEASRCTSPPKKNSDPYLVNLTNCRWFMAGFVRAINVFGLTHGLDKSERHNRYLLLLSGSSLRTFKIASIMLKIF
jgi:hypothetical protein